jgi:hypothetical protein
MYVHVVCGMRICCVEGGGEKGDGENREVALYTGDG